MQKEGDKLTPQELALAHLRMALGQRATFPLPGTGELVTGQWGHHQGFFIELPIGPDRPPVPGAFTAEVTVDDPTGIHRFVASLTFEPPATYQLLSMGVIQISQRRSFIRVPLATKLQFYRVGFADDASRLPWGETVNLSPTGLAFRGPGSVGSGEELEVIFREPPWNDLPPLRGRVVAVSRQLNGQNLYRLELQDPQAVTRLKPLIAKAHRQIVAAFSRSSTSDSA